VKLASLEGRAVLVEDGRAVDVEAASSGAFGPGLEDVYERWLDFVAAAPGFDRRGAREFEPSELGCCSPMPRQVIAVGLNYESHALETGLPIPELPAVFTKFPTCLTGPEAEVALGGTTVDWEVELVVVIGVEADRVREEDAWDHVAGLSVGQDLSDRTVQFAAGAQFSLGKSYAGYGPVGPWLVTLDELEDPDDLALGCRLNGETVQEDRTSGLVFSVPRLIAELSGMMRLLPGDMIFTGTPAGVGMVASPPRFLADGDLLESWVEGIGTIRTRLRAPKQGEGRDHG
jgi:2-keto-4-pentenoate hydratase/2-oxohepta-3-ene-1,7-dioic acid hydratase in catechol pathway